MYRPEIMKHLHESLAEATGKNWKRAYSSLLLIESLLTSGAPEIIAETAEGRHFDLVQRLSFLEHFGFTDETARSLLQGKAKGLRKIV